MLLVKLTTEEMKQVTILRNLFKGQKVDCKLSVDSDVTSVTILKKQERATQENWWQKRNSAIKMNVYYFSDSDTVTTDLIAYYNNKQINLQVAINIEDLRRIKKHTELKDLSITPEIRCIRVELKDVGQITLETL